MSNPTHENDNESPTLLTLPRELLSIIIINNLDAASTAALALTSRAFQEEVHFTYCYTNLGSLAPSLPPGQAVTAKRNCDLDWLVGYLAQGDVKVENWRSAFATFERLVEEDGCQWCGYVLFMYRMRGAMGKEWCLCPERLRYYRKRGRGGRHRCRNAGGCMRESYRMEELERLKESEEREKR